MPPHTDTPREQPEHDGVIQRWEFNALRDSVKRIEKALIGGNHMDPDPHALVGKVNAHDRDIAHAKWLSRTAIGGLIAAGMAWLVSKMTGHTP